MSSQRNALLPYGVDAPGVLVGLTAGGLACCLVGFLVPVFFFPGVTLLLSAATFLHTTVRGKLVFWRAELDRLGLRGDERVVDLGCGRGAVLVEAARRVPRGQAVGVDLWRTKDQSGNDPEVTRANAQAAGVADRVELHTADLTSLPFPDASFDAVLSALAIHNIPTEQGRLAALDEAVRVLRPGGRLVVVDIQFARRYAEHLAGAEVKGLGWGYWYGGPWVGASAVRMTKAG